MFVLLVLVSLVLTSTHARVTLVFVVQVLFSLSRSCQDCVVQVLCSRSHSCQDCVVQGCACALTRVVLVSCRCCARALARVVLVSSSVHACSFYARAH